MTLYYPVVLDTAADALKILSIIQQASYKQHIPNAS